MTEGELYIQHRCVAGLDVHKKQITAHVRKYPLDGAGLDECTKRFNTLPSGLEEMMQWFQSRSVEATLMESTGIYWYAPYEALERTQVKVQLVNARQVRQLKGRKTDVSDAQWLAYLCQYGLGSPSYVPPKLFRELRNLMRFRRKLTQRRAQVCNRVHKLIDRRGLHLGGILSDIFGLNGRHILDGLAAGVSRETIIEGLTHHVRRKVEALFDMLTLELSDIDRFLLEDLLTEYDSLNVRIARAERSANSQLAPYRESLQLLQTIPGIGAVATAEILVELGPDLSEFKSQRHLAAWAGLCPGNDQSADKRRSAKMRQGNKALRAVLTECAHAAARTKGCQFESYHQSLKIRLGLVLPRFGRDVSV